MLAGGAILFPSLGLLFRLTLTGKLHADDDRAPGAGGGGERPSAPAALARTAAATFAAGLGLLTFADAAWAHALGLACLAVFALAGFFAIIGTALAE